jgi:hypothetical protein
MTKQRRDAASTFFFFFLRAGRLSLDVCERPLLVFLPLPVAVPERLGSQCGDSLHSWAKYRFHMYVFRGTRPWLHMSAIQ